MTTTLTATYTGGVFKPETPVDLPENSKVELTLKPANGAATVKPAPGSSEAWEAYIEHLKQLNFRSGEPRPTREDLYEGR